MWDRWNDQMYREDLEPYGLHLKLYHYTTHDGALGILASNSLRATETNCLNDSTELIQGLPICFRAIEAVDDARFQFHREVLKNGLREQFQCRTFVACFSRAIDIKSQWERYADQQRGYAIAFDNLGLSWLRGVRLMPVEYGPAAQERRAQRAVNRALRNIYDLEHSGIPFSLTVHSRFTLLAVELYYLCATFKSADWAPEEEWRLIYTHRPRDEEAFDTQLSNDGRQRPFVSLEFDRTFGGDPRPFYAAIRAGPLVGANSVALVQRFLREHGLQIPWEQQLRFER